MRPEPSRVEGVKRLLQQSGLSGRASRQLSLCVRESTARLYQSQWLSFCSWCRGRSIAPIDATMPVIVDFLIHLRQDKSFSLSALEGLLLHHKLGFRPQGVGLSKLEGTINALPQSCKNLFFPGPLSPSLGRGPGPTEFDQPNL